MNIQAVYGYAKLSTLAYVDLRLTSSTFKERKKNIFVNTIGGCRNRKVARW